MKRKIRNITNYFLNKVGLQIKSNIRNQTFDREFEDIYKICKDHTMTSKLRMYSLFKSVEYIVKNKIEGEIVECGVWKGGSAMLAALTLKKFGDTTRDIYLYDTYEGMTKPTKDDRYIKNNESVLSKWKDNQKANHNTWCYSPIEEVKYNMKKTMYPENKIIYVKGKVEETIPKKVPKKISILRLDTDWYESTKHELIHMYPLLETNGVIIIDDYGTYVGAKKAVDEYFRDKPPLLSRIDNTGRVGIKI